MTTTKQYTLQDFNTIIWGGFSSDLKDSGVIELVCDGLLNSLTLLPL